MWTESENDALDRVVDQSKDFREFNTKEAYFKHLELKFNKISKGPFRSSAALRTRIYKYKKAKSKQNQQKKNVHMQNKSVTCSVRSKTKKKSKKRMRSEIESNRMDHELSVSPKCKCGNDLKLMIKGYAEARVCDKCGNGVGRQFYQCAKSRIHPDCISFAHFESFDVCLDCVRLAQQ